MYVICYTAKMYYKLKDHLFIIVNHLFDFKFILHARTKCLCI